MRFEAFVAMRYLRGRRKNLFISLITLISVAGVSVGVIALIVVMSVMTGFDNALRDTIIGNRAHLVVEDPLGNMPDFGRVMEDIEALCQEIEASAPFVQVEALLKGPLGQPTGALIIGVDPQRETNVTQLADNLTTGNGRSFGRGRLPQEGEVVLGYLLAGRLRVGLGDEIEVVTARASVTPMYVRNVQSLWLTVSGISQAQMFEFDTVYAYVDLATAELLTGAGSSRGVHCKLNDPFHAELVAEQIENGLTYSTTTWYESQQAFFEALRQEKFAMFIILVFIILVAAFNITSTLIMVVMEKRRDIGIMRTLGVSSESVLFLFVLEGLFIGLSGTAIGVLCGTLLAYNINPVATFLAGLFNIDLFNSQIYYFDKIPVAVVGRDVLWITVAAVFLTLLSTLYPAWSATRLRPVDALRYE